MLKVQVGESKTQVGENRLLAALPEEDFRLLRHQLVPVQLSRGESIYMQGDKVEHLYFPVSCVLSTVGILSDGATVEIAMIGHEGVAGINSVFGDHPARNWTRALIPGDALKLRANALHEAFARSEAVRMALLRYYRLLITQVSQRAVCNGRHTVIQRLCCWLLMVGDCFGSDELPLTQEEIASRLGARRAGVTEAARMLLPLGLINYTRGRINILDRNGMQAVSCECYRIYCEELNVIKNAGGRDFAHDISAGF